MLGSAKIREGGSEMDSPGGDKKDARANSIMSIPSRDSGAENLQDILALCEELNFVIKDGEWHNIPAPVRRTCEVIIDFQ